MIRFSCPTCRKALKAPDHGAGQKVHCPRCGQRVLIPPPIEVQNRTVLGEPMPAPAIVSPPPPVPREPPTNPFDFDSQDGGHSGADAGFSPHMRGTGSPIPGLLSSIARTAGTGHEHSGLGIASFLIALLVGGLDVILALVIVIGIARSASQRERDYYGYDSDSRERVVSSMVAGGAAMICLNCLSIPLCLVGVGLAIVGLVAHRDRNHFFTWIGLFGNGIVIFGVVGMYVFGAMMAN